MGTCSCEEAAVAGQPTAGGARQRRKLQPPPPLAHNFNTALVLLVPRVNVCRAFGVSKGYLACSHSSGSSGQMCAAGPRASAPDELQCLGGWPLPAAARRG
jgi:hypothetical protein